MRALCWTIAPSFSAFRTAACAALLGVAASGCTLITDIDREKIPDPPLPPFPERDAGAQPGLDASAPPELDAGAPPGPDAGDAGDAGDGGISDAGLDAEVDASAGP
jgi:hypothetical protein